MDSLSIEPSAASHEMPREWSESGAAIDRVLSKQLFFIGGFPKSGTTWLRWLLDAHPAISCSGEGHFINRFSGGLAEALQTHSKLIALKNGTIFKEMPGFPVFTEAHFRYLLTSAIALLLDEASNPAALAIGEKTPDNLAHYALLSSLFPSARFVHIVRDPRDCAVSAWFHNHRTNPTALLTKFGTFERYAEHIGAAWAQAMALGDAFAKSHPGRCYLLRYEDLLASPLKTLGPLIWFLGVDAAPAVVDVCVQKASFETFSDGRPRGSEDRSSFFRLGVAEDWRNHFSADANQAFLAANQATMDLHGYR